MKTAFLFPGQGSQYAGMGQSLAQNFPAARRRFEEADDALGFALSGLCFEGPEEELKLTENQQPALLAVSVAAWTVLLNETGAPDFVAGHSLGEYPALVAAGSLDFADALRLVRKRGQYMQEAVPAGVGAMAALLKLPLDDWMRFLRRPPKGRCLPRPTSTRPIRWLLPGTGPRCFGLWNSLKPPAHGALSCCPSAHLSIAR